VERARGARRTAGRVGLSRTCLAPAENGTQAVKLKRAFKEERRRRSVHPKLSLAVTLKAIGFGYVTPCSLA
jgi:hypothetical protein